MTEKGGSVINTINKEKYISEEDTVYDILKEMIHNIKEDKCNICDNINSSTLILETYRRKLEKYEATSSQVNDKLFSPSSNQTIDYRKAVIESISEEEEKLNNYNILYNDLVMKEKDLSLIQEFILSKKSSKTRESNSINCNEPNGLKLLETQEIERNRIARELHDSTVQNLTNLVHKTELCTKLVDMDPIRAKLELQTMISTIKTTINDMRSIIYDLRPMSLDDLGLVITVQRFIKQFIESSNVKVLLHVENEVKINIDIVDLTLFRIIQEACNNAVKHAQANTIRINLKYYEQSIELDVEDDGCGFDQNNIIYASNKSLSGFGLSMMKERVHLLSGKIDITSGINKGTKVSVQVPVCTCIKENI